METASAPDHAADHAADHAPGTAPDTAGDHAPDTAPDHEPTHAPGTTTDHPTGGDAAPARSSSELCGVQAAQRSSRRLRLGIMGGTFDPIHNGHLVAGSEVADMFGLDTVVYVPTGQPWQKRDRGVSAAEDRYLMTVIATASNPRFTVSRVDIDREGDTFTVDTLHDIRAEYPDAELFFITGADALERIVTWRDWEGMFDLAHFVGVTRPGHDLDGVRETLAREIERGTLSLVEIPAMAISSTDCRERAASGRPVWYLVPDGVVQYIGKHGMYRERPDGRAG